MNAQELAAKFTAKIAVAAVEKDRQKEIAEDNVGKRTADIEHCKKAMEQHVLPFLDELKHHLGEHQFSFAPQIELNDTNQSERASALTSLSREKDHCVLESDASKRAMEQNVLPFLAD